MEGTKPAGTDKQVAALIIKTALEGTDEIIDSLGFRDKRKGRLKDHVDKMVAPYMKRMTNLTEKIKVEEEEGTLETASES